VTKKTYKKGALVSSVIALLLCCAMLVGTTFAWFTDSASSGVNKIQAGTLDIQLLDAEGNSLEGKTLSWQKAAGHENDEVLWEPGCTYNLQTITIKNNGTLALKYKIEITGILGDAKLNEAIDWTITNSNSVSDLGADHSLAAGACDTLTISGTMKTTAGNEYQNLTIDGIAITVLATQDTVEYDSFDNQYDKDAAYPEAESNAKEYVKKLNAGHNVNSYISASTGADYLPIAAVMAEITGYSVFDGDTRITNAVSFCFNRVEKQTIDENSYRILVDLAIKDDAGKDLELKPGMPSTINGKEYLHVFMNLLEVPEGYSVSEVKVNDTALTETMSGNPVTGEYWIGSDGTGVYFQSMEAGLIEVTIAK